MALSWGRFAVSSLYVGERRRFGSVRVDYVRPLRLGKRMSAARFALVCLDTWQIETFAAPVRIVDLNDLAGDEYVPDGDDYTDDSRVIDLATDHGVSVADLWAAYQWRENLRAAGVLDDVEKYVMAVLS